MESESESEPGPATDPGGGSDGGDAAGSENAAAPAAPPVGPLGPVEARVLGCLMEKAATTPEYYPLTLNSLLAACNQKSNRNPVVEFEEDEVARALEELRDQHLVLRVDTAGSRVPKYRHRLMDVLDELEEPGAALLCVLLLRGAQTVGELRTRTERVYPFDDLLEVEDALERLADYPDGPLVDCLPPGAGRRVKTFVHLLGGPVDTDDPAPGLAAAGVPTPLEPATVRAQAEREREAALRAEVDGLRAETAALREEVAQLRATFDEFRRQFE